MIYELGQLYLWWYNGFNNLALFTGDRDEEDEMIPVAGAIGNNLVVSSSTGRYVTLSCQTCRKLKKHKEIEPNLYQWGTANISEILYAKQNSICKKPNTFTLRNLACVTY